MLFEGEACGESEMFEGSAGLLLGGAGLTSFFWSGEVASWALGAGKGGNCTQSLLTGSGLFVLAGFVSELASLELVVEIFLLGRGGKCIHSVLNLMTEPESLAVFELVLLICA